MHHRRPDGGAARDCEWRRRRGRTAGAARRPAAAGASQLAVGMVNWVATLLVTPHPLPRMDFAARHPRPHRARWWWSRRCSPARQPSTSLLEALEVRFLANRDAHAALRPADRFPGRRHADAARRRAAAAARAARASQRSTRSTPSRTRYLPTTRTRRRSSCSTARAGGTRGSACGWAASASAASSATSTRCCAARRRSAFRSIVGATWRCCASVKYVITLDTDTQLPRDAARQFVGAMAHPLNRPRFGIAAARRQRARDDGLRHPAAAREHQPAGREPLAGTRA